MPFQWAARPGLRCLPVLPGLRRAGRWRRLDRLGTSAQGYPVSFAVDGRQYIAVMSGLGGGSPRNVPAAIIPDIKIPQSGQALYVFALPQ